MKQDIVCKVVDNVRVCVDRNHKNPFVQAKEIDTIIKENGKFRLDFNDKCKFQGIQCLSQNLKVVFLYFAVYLFTSFLVNSLHEAFHFSVFYLSGEDVSGFSFGFNLGYTEVKQMPPVSSHGLLWWYFAIMGPLFFVNFLSVFFVYLLYRPDGYIRYFRVRNDLVGRLGEVFVKSIAYISTLSILMNTIFTPVLGLFSMGTGREIKSDLQWAWDVSLSMSTEPYHGLWYYVWVSVILLLLLSAVIIKREKKITEFIIVFVIVLSVISVFFFTGISERAAFQIMIVTSVAIEIPLSLVYIFEFGKKS